MISLGKYFFNRDKIASKFSLLYIFIAILGLVSLNKVIEIYIESNNIVNEIPLSFGIFFISITAIILYLMINHMQKVIKNIEQAYNDLKKKEEYRLAPYEFALDNSVDAIHWFTLDGKFIYVNDATCKMDGYTKEEYEKLYLEDIDPSFTRETAIKCMNDIKHSHNWRIESSHRRKDGSSYPVEVTGHSFIYNGQEYICAFARDISQRISNRKKITAMNEDLQKSVKEKEILLKEIHHRVKNNMEIISSLLNMQAFKSEDKKFKDAMKESRSKINAMALVHEFLYLGENLAYINVNEYIERLVEDIKELYISNNTHIEVDLNIEKIELSVNRCIQVGMLIHELCVNAFKYAFSEDKKNLLCIHMKLENENIHLKIRDNGKGLEDLNRLEKSDSIGMQLIHSIVDFQLEGTIDFKNNEGLECNIIFPKKEECYE